MENARIFIEKCAHFCENARISKDPYPPGKFSGFLCFLESTAKNEFFWQIFDIYPTDVRFDKKADL